MGYDMYFRGKHYQDGDEVYFRLNIWGMSKYCDYMLERGMVFDAGSYPEWPKPPDDMDWDAYYDGPGQDTPAVAAYRQAQDEVLSWHGPEVPGIPLHKFGSNDGWIVTSAECEAAYRIGKDAPRPEGAEDGYWEKWLDYLNRAASNGGFEVH